MAFPRGEFVERGQWQSRASLLGRGHGDQGGENGSVEAPLAFLARVRRGARRSPRHLQASAGGRRSCGLPLVAAAVGSVARAPPKASITAVRASTRASACLRIISVGIKAVTKLVGKGSIVLARIYWSHLIYATLTRLWTDFLGTPRNFLLLPKSSNFALSVLLLVATTTIIVVGAYHWCNLVPTPGGSGSQKISLFQCLSPTHQPQQFPLFHLGPHSQPTAMALPRANHNSQHSSPPLPSASPNHCPTASPPPHHLHFTH